MSKTDPSGAGRSHGDRPNDAENPTADPTGRVPPTPGDENIKSEPLETDEGDVVVLAQQNVGRQVELGSGEFPDPDAPPKDPGQVKRDQDALDRSL